MFLKQLQKAVEDAKKNLVKIPLIGQISSSRTKGKFGGARVFLIPASHGTGVMLELFVQFLNQWVFTMYCLNQGSSNPHTVKQLLMLCYK
jgi:small subunit ribosomal protein S5